MNEHKRALLEAYVAYDSIERLIDVLDDSEWDVKGEDFVGMLEQVLAEHGGCLE